MARRVPLRVVVLLAGALLAAVVVFAVVVLRDTSSGQDGIGAPIASTPGKSAFPGPPRGAVVFSRQLGADALALAVVPQAGRVLLQASVVGTQGEGVSGLPVAFRIRDRTRDATSCGPGCYRATLPAAERPASVVVDVGGARAARWRVSLPAQWPPRDATQLLARAGRAWRSLRSVAFTERIASDAEHVVDSSWRIEAPDRVAYEVRDGWSGVVIGTRRWDRPPGGGRWATSPQTRLTQPVPAWASVANAHVLGEATVQGRPAWRVSFFDPASRAWFTVALDRRTHRTLDLRMTTTAHFMHDVYGSFNQAAPIRPPG